ncbi:hypothetical protein MKX36_02515 [Paenibacillus sp. FSL W8-0439]|uniref:hypothetical protein n=1 Tax=Paenibacillus sp. FSL W8-0439 TaxID=2921716 RepID=UPI0030F800FF
MKLVNFYNKVIGKMIILVEKYKNYIPLSKYLLIYLRIPFFLKLIIGFLFGLVSWKTYYAIGFIILQSRAKNEVLSIIKAYQNPIKFSDELIYSYSFMFCFLFLFSLIPVYIIYFYISYLKKFFNRNNNSKVKKFFQFLLITAFFLIAEFLFGYMIVIKSSPYVAYLMLYESKNSTFVEYIINYLLGEIDSLPNINILSYDFLSSKIMASLTLGNIILWALITILVYLWILMKKVKHILWFFTCNIFVLVLFLVVFVLYTHTFFQLGNFGKSISDYDLDYVCIEYELNGKKELKGLRVYQGDGHIVIRDSSNQTHDISSDTFHIKTISSMSTKCGK